MNEIVKRWGTLFLGLRKSLYECGDCQPWSKALAPWRKRWPAWAILKKASIICQQRSIQSSWPVSTIVCNWSCMNVMAGLWKRMPKAVTEQWCWEEALESPLNYENPAINLKAMWLFIARGPMPKLKLNTLAAWLKAVEDPVSWGRDGSWRQPEMEMIWMAIIL